MKAMILAAGLGTRLHPLTDKKPKALMPVGNRPIIDRVISYLEGHGVTQIIVNAHHHSRQILDHLQGGRNAADIGQLGVALVAVWIFWGAVSSTVALTWIGLFALGLVLRVGYRTYAITDDTPASQVLSIVRRDVWLSATLGYRPFCLHGLPDVSHALHLGLIHKGLGKRANHVLALCKGEKAFLGEVAFEG